MILSYNCNTSSGSQNCLSPDRLKVNQGVGQKNLLPSPISLICLRDPKPKGGECLRRGPASVTSRVV